MTPEERAQQGLEQATVMSEADRIAQLEATAAQMAQDKAHLQKLKSKL